MEILRLLLPLLRSNIDAGSVQPLDIGFERCGRGEAPKAGGIGSGDQLRTFPQENCHWFGQFFLVSIRPDKIENGTLFLGVGVDMIVSRPSLMIISSLATGRSSMCRLEMQCLRFLLGRLQLLFMPL